MNCRGAGLALLSATAFLLLTDAEALSAAEQKAAAEPSTIRELIDKTVEDVQVFADAETATPARPAIALRWANNARGSEDGTTVIYVHNGRPLAVACLYPWEGDLVQDFGSLAPGPIVARRAGKVVWRPRQAGIRFADVPEAPAPETSAAQRLRRMKSLSAKFQCTMLGWKAGGDDDREELRLLARPLYRYETEEGEILDGAVFGFVMGTDPEAILLIEAVDDGDTRKWRFAFARRTSGELEARYRGATVWKVGRFSNLQDLSNPILAIQTPIPETVAGANGQ